MEEALNEHKGAKELYVQPSHLIPGEEYEKLLGILEEHKSMFGSIKVGHTLLHTIEDCKKVCEIICNQISLGEKEGLMLIGHGSEHYANYVYPTLDYMFKETGYNNIFVGTVEGYPMVDTVVARLKETDIEKFYLAPLMLVEVDHAKTDIDGD